MSSLASLLRSKKILFKMTIYCITSTVSLLNFSRRKLVGACERVKNGLKKLLETNELVDKMQVRYVAQHSLID